MYVRIVHVNFEGVADTTGNAEFSSLHTDCKMVMQSYQMATKKDLDTFKRK
jgi:hypothetical protein